MEHWWEDHATCLVAYIPPYKNKHTEKVRTNKAILIISTSTICYLHLIISCQKEIYRFSDAGL